MTDITLNIEGVGKVSVDSSFKDLSSDQQNAFVSHIAQQHAKGISSSEATPAPAEPAQAPDGSLENAAVQSVIHGLPAALAGGAATIGQTIDERTGMKPGGLVGGLRNFANEQRQQLAENYQRPADVAPSASAALAQGHIAEGLRSLGYGAAENLGTTGAALGGGALALASAPVSALGALAAGGVTALEAADSVNEGRRAAGLKADQGLTNTDLANLAAQTATNVIPGGRGVGLLGALGRAGTTFGRAALDSAENAGSEAIQGGNVGTPEDVMQNAVDNGLNGLGQHVAARVAAGAGGVAADRAQRGADYLRLSPQMRQGLQDLAAAQQSDTPIQNASPEAQAASRVVDSIPIIQTRRDAEGANAAFRPIQETIGANRTELQQTLENIAGNLKQSGAINSTDHKALVKAITQAHNQNATAALTPSGEEGAGLQTHMDRVAQMDLDPEIKQQFLHGLGVLDTTAANKVKKRANPVWAPALKGVATNAFYSLPMALGVGGGAVHGMAGGAEGAILGAGLGALAGKAGQVAGNVGSRLDSYFGHGVPDVLQRTGPVQRQMARLGVAPSVTGAGLQALEADTAQAAQERQAAAVSPFQRPRAPQAPQQAPQAQAAPQQPAQAAPQGEPQQAAPFDLSSIDLSATDRQNPGWMGPLETLEPNKTKLHNFLANLREAGSITPQEHEVLSTTDNIGPALRNMQNTVSDLQAAGNWEKATQRGPGAPTYTFATPSGRPQGASSSPKAQTVNLDAQGNPILSQFLYNRAAQNNAAARDTALKGVTDPVLIDVIHRTHDARTMAEKNAIVETYLATKHGPKATAEAYARLRPLLSYGR